MPYYCFVMEATKSMRLTRRSDPVNLPPDSVCGEGDLIAYDPDPDPEPEPVLVPTGDFEACVRIDFETGWFLIRLARSSLHDCGEHAVVVNMGWSSGDDHGRERYYVLPSMLFPISNKV